MKGFVHSIESFGSVDGPGIRFLIFLQGCPMRCQFCHNPDSWKTGVGEEWTADDLLDKAERFKSYWGDKGGITVSGGEALMQIDFLIELFEKAHQRGINTCLDTSAQPFRKEGAFFDKFERLMAVTGRRARPASAAEGLPAGPARRRPDSGNWACTRHSRARRRCRRRRQSGRR